MIEQEEYTFNEFKAWLAGLIRGKRGALPDIEDWKAIKEMLDKVVPDVADAPNWIPPAPIIIREVVKEEKDQPYDWQVPVTPQPIWITPHPSDGTYPNGTVWCSGISNVSGGYAGDVLTNGGYAGGGMTGGSAGAGGGVATNVGGVGGAASTGYITLSGDNMQGSTTDQMELDLASDMRILVPLPPE